MCARRHEQEGRPGAAAYPTPWILSALMVRMTRTWSRPRYLGDEALGQVHA